MTSICYLICYLLVHGNDDENRLALARLERAIEVDRGSYFLRSALLIFFAAIL
jgi:hypothetical protein